MVNNSEAFFFATTKVAIIATLFAVFLLYFGCPSYERFRKGDTVFSERQVPLASSRPMGITVYAQNEWMNGWKNYSGRGINYTKFCNTTDDYGKMVECINEKTYSHDDMINKYTVIDANDTYKDVTNTTVWREGITTAFPGRFVTIETFLVPQEDYSLSQPQLIHISTAAPNFTLVLFGPPFAGEGSKVIEQS